MTLFEPHHIYFHQNQQKPGNSLVVLWSGLHTFTAEGMGSVPGWGNKILQTAQCSQKKKKNPQTNKKAPQKPVRASKSKECKLSWGNPRGQMQLCLQTSWTSGQDRYGDVCTLSYLSGTQACLPQFRPSSLLSLLDAKATHFSPIFTSDRVDSLLGPLPDSQGRDSSPA